MKANYLNARFLQWPDCFVDVPACNQTMIRDKQRASKIQLARKLAEALDRACAKDHSRPRLKIKTLHLFLAAKRHKKHKRPANTILCFLCLSLYGLAAAAGFATAVAGLPAAD